MPRPKIRLTCCLCGATVAQNGAVYPLDSEWLRRHPDILGILACRCAIGGDRYWRCQGPDGRYVEGHIPVADPKGPDCIDSWSHLGIEHTPVAAVTAYPRSALRQGAEDYLRYTAQRRGTPRRLASHLQVALAEWDAPATVEAETAHAPRTAPMDAPSQ